MRYRFTPDAAWDVADGTAYAVRLPDGRPLVLAGVAPLLLELVAAELDPVEEALRRWPDAADEIPSSVGAFLAQLSEAGIVEPVPAGPTIPAPAPTDDPAPVVKGPRRAIEATPEPYRVLFVCTANICRSAYADVVARAMGLDGIEFSSAGTHALVGSPMDPPMAARVTCGDAGAHRARQLTGDIVEDADLILCMSERHRAYILEEWPTAARRTFVIGQATRGMATWAGDDVRGLAEHLWRSRTTTRPDDAVADPYGRGPEAASACARRLDELVAVVVERLGQPG